MIKKLIKLALLASALPVAAQTTHTYPALDTNNSFTGTNTFGNTVTLSTLMSCSGLGTNGSGNITCSGGGGGMVYPSAGVAVSNGSAWVTPSFTNIVSLWASGSCTSGYLKYDGTCSTPSGSGIPYPTGVAYFFGDSRLKASSGATTTATATSCNGTVCTITDTQSYTAGQYIMVNTEGGTWNGPSCLNGSVFQVLSSGLSGTQFEINEVDPNANAQQCSGTLSGAGGPITDATNFIPQDVGREPMFSGHVTANSMQNAGGALSSLVTNYSTLIHPYMPAVTSVTPTYAYIMGGFDDVRVFSCPTLSSLESSLTSLWTSIHTDGGIVVQITESPVLNAGAFCTTQSILLMQLQQWEIAQGPGSTTTGAHWDYLIDASPHLNSPAGLMFNSNVYSNAGNQLVADLVNVGMAAKGSVNLGQSTGAGTNYSDGPNYTVIGTQDDQCPINWLNASFSTVYQNCYNLSSNVWFNLIGTSSSPADSLSVGSGTVYHTLPNNGVWGWRSSTSQTAGTDTGLSRGSAGVVDVGNGSNGDTSGSLKSTYDLLAGTTSDLTCSTGSGSIWYNSSGNQLKACINGTVTPITPGAVTNITSAITWSGCTVSGGRCTTGSTQTTVTASSIPQTYNSIRILIRASTTAGNNYIAAQFNSDTGSHYYGRVFGQNGAGSINDAVNGGTSMHLGYVAPYSYASAPGGIIDCTILDYSVSLPTQQVTCTNASNTSNGELTATTGINYSPASSSAVTSAAFFSSTGADTISSGTSITVYGIQ